VATIQHHLEPLVEEFMQSLGLERPAASKLAVAARKGRVEALQDLAPEEFTTQLYLAFNVAHAALQCVKVVP
jgi:hypothetical protein